MFRFFEAVTIEKVSLPDAFEYIEASVIAMLFNLLLLMIVEAQRGRRRQGESTFSSVLLSVLFANAVTCLYVFLSSANIGFGDTAVCVLQALALLCNTIVSYFFAAYVLYFVNRTLQEDTKMPLINRLLPFAEALLLTGWLIFAVPYILRNHTLIRPAGLFYVIVAFAMEVWPMLYAMLIIVRKRSILGTRAQLTVIVTFLLTIGTVLLQAFLGRAPVINYLGATFGMFVFYFNVETPDYLALERALIELEEAKKQSDAASEAKSGFLSNMSHEIRTPLSAILGMNEMILREEKDKTILSYARSVERAGQNLLSVINDILDFSKIESGKLTLLEDVYSLTKVLRDVCGIISFRAAEKGLVFHAQIEESTPESFYGDVIRLRQMMLNLLGNAVKYTRQGSVTLAVKCDGLRHAGNHVMTTLSISVKDTGIGIAKEDMERLFDKFERVDMKQNSSVEGTGLGLAIVKEISDLMGGQVEVKSAYGEGSEFILRIPQRVEGEKKVGDLSNVLFTTEEQSRTYRAQFRAPDARVLVVDDADINLLVFQKLLKQTRLMIDTALSGLDAIAMTQDTPYDLIFLDQRMSGMSGAETLSYIRSQEGGVNTKTSVICLTADAVQGAKDRYLALGFTDYLSKPIDAARLESMIMQYLPEDKLYPPAEGEEDEENDKEHPSAPGEEDTSEEEKTPSSPDERTLRRFYDDTGILSFRTAIHHCQDAETLFEILKEYYVNIPENIRQLKEYSEAGDTGQYNIRVHALKSASRMIGATDLAESAYHLEQTAEQGDIETIRGETPQLIGEYEEIASHLAKLMAKYRQDRIITEAEHG